MTTARAWLGGLAVMAVLGGSVFLLTRETEPCSFSASAIDGYVLPGGPQSADEAFEGFLATTDDLAMTERAFGAYERIENGPTQVSFVHDGVTVGVYRQLNGWMVGGVEANPC